MLSKLLKVLFAIEFFLILVIIVLALIDSKQMPTGYVVRENPSTENTDFKLLTKAVCEEKSGHVICYDKLFIKCNGKEYIVNENNSDNLVECNKLKLNLSNIKVNGTALFRNKIDTNKTIKN